MTLNTGRDQYQPQQGTGWAHWELEVTGYCASLVRNVVWLRQRKGCPYGIYGRSIFGVISMSIILRDKSYL